MEPKLERGTLTITEYPNDPGISRPIPGKPILHALDAEALKGIIKTMADHAKQIAALKSDIYREKTKRRALEERCAKLEEELLSIHKMMSS